MLYWVSLLIQDTEQSKPWVNAISTGCISLEKALESIKKGRKHFRVLSAWVDTFDECNNKTTVFHECYVNSLGNIESKEKSEEMKIFSWNVIKKDEYIADGYVVAESREDAEEKLKLLPYNDSDTKIELDEDDGYEGCNIDENGIAARWFR